MGTPAERELSYAELKINQNFSNYSAWHYRTKLLPLVPTGGGYRKSDSHHSVGDYTATDTNLEELIHSTETSKAIALLPKQVLDAEYELVKQAFYTEPTDQSAWFYHRWLLAQSQARYTIAAAFVYSNKESEVREDDEKQHLIGVLGKEKEMCEQLLELEPDAKWPLLTLTRLQEMLDALLTVEERKDSVGKVDYKVQYGVLREIDPMRRGYYKDEEEGMAKVGLRLA
jgi:geranylgeranyl transferase type-2 subunit alpha